MSIPTTYSDEAKQGIVKPTGLDQGTVRRLRQLDGHVDAAHTAEQPLNLPTEAQWRTVLNM